MQFQVDEVDLKHYERMESICTCHLGSWGQFVSTVDFKWANLVVIGSQAIITEVASLAVNPIKEGTTEVLFIQTKIMPQKKLAKALKNFLLSPDVRRQCIRVWKWRTSKPVQGKYIQSFPITEHLLPLTNWRWVFSSLTLYPWLYIGWVYQRSFYWLFFKTLMDIH